MQVFRLVSGGFVDKMIAFDSLPERLLKGIRTRDISGMPRYWAKWLNDNGCTRDVYRTTTEVLPDRNLKVNKISIGQEPCFYVLEYTDLNTDKEKWQEISNYVRKAVITTTRLMDKLEDMAKKMAQDPHAQLELEPEDVPVIEVPKEVIAERDDKEIIRSSEEVLTPTGDSVMLTPKKRGRPKKVAVEA